MHSYFIRGNLIFFFALSCLFMLAVGCSISALFHNPTVDVHISNHRLLRLGAIEHPHLKGEQAYLSFDIDADLRPLWNWNVKQAFMWIAVDFPTPSRSHNAIVLWDAVIRSKDDSLVQRKDMRAEYPLTDVQKELRGRTLNVTVGWDLMPIVGVLRHGGGSAHNSYQITLPSSYQ